MAKSFYKLLYHIIFSTKNREPWLRPEIRSRVHRYLAATVKGEGGIPIVINGTADHVHIVADLRQDRALSDTIRVVKANSSKWVREAFPNWADFRWQSGYGAFTVSQSQVGGVQEYIEEQEEHHRRLSFQEEFVALLERHGIKYEERDLRD